MRLCILLAALLFCLPVMAADEPASLTITSPQFENEGKIPILYTCGGADINPPLQFGNIPAEASALVLFVEDPDAPVGNWVHWVLYNIPPDVTQIAEQAAPGQQGLNDFGRFRYGGPCPPDEKPHRYFFRLYALDEPINIAPGPTKMDVMDLMKKHIIGKGELMGTYQKPVGQWK